MTFSHFLAALGVIAVAIIVGVFINVLSGLFTSRKG
jgi:uncharacterized membrane protein (DUF106 family)